jgi:hypothetical protein
MTSETTSGQGKNVEEVRIQSEARTSIKMAGGCRETERER